MTFWNDCSIASHAVKVKPADGGPHRLKRNPENQVQASVP